MVMLVGFLLLISKLFKIMNIQPYIDFDKELLLKWNGSDSLFWDGFIWVTTNTYIWIPLAIVLLYVIIKNNKLREALTIIAMIAIVITMADQISSGFCKPFFARFRPTQDPEIMYQVDIVNGYRGGRYGFVSSHAANSFGLALFLTLLIKSKLLSVTLFSWATLNAYTRIYLGVHYPGDILFGTLVGLSSALIVYLIYKTLQKKIFGHSRFISSQYTESGYLKSDIRMIVTTFILTLFSIILISILINESIY